MLAPGLTVPYHRSMALSQFEKDCIAEIVAPLTGRRSPHKLTAEQQASLTTVTEGDEAERQTLITDYINDEGLDAVAAQISGCDDEMTRLTALKVTLQTKEAAMEAYVAP